MHDNIICKTEEWSSCISGVIKVEKGLRVHWRQRLFLPGTFVPASACSWTKQISLQTPFPPGNPVAPPLFTQHTLCVESPEKIDVLYSMELIHNTQWKGLTKESQCLYLSPFPITEDGRTYPGVFRTAFGWPTREMGEDEMACGVPELLTLTFGPSAFNNVQATFSTPNTAFSLPPSPQVNLQETSMFLGELDGIISAFLPNSSRYEYCLIGLYFLPVRISFLGHLHLNEEIKRVQTIHPIHY